MERIGVRELRQHASRWLARVQLGESFEVTDRGRPVALLVPAPPGRINQLRASGRLRPPSGPLDLSPPPEAAAGTPLLSEILAEQRADER